MEVLVRAACTVLLFLTAAMPAVVAADNRIVVEPIANSSDDPGLDPLSSGFSDLLVAYLSVYDDLEILYRDDLYRLWQELAQRKAGLEKTDTERIAALIQANTLIKGGFVKTRDSIQVNVHVYDIATAQLRFSFEERSNIQDADTLASGLAKRIADRLLNQGGATTPLPVDAQPPVNMHFMKGLGYHYSGLYDHAVAEFMQVIDLDPAHADARLWLGKSYAGGGEHDHARIEFERFLRDFPGHEDSSGVHSILNTLSR